MHTRAYYVAKNGSDSNNGSIGAPFLTIAKGITGAANNSTGTTVYVSPGTYTENLTLSNKNVSIIASGSFPYQQLNTSIYGTHTYSASSGTNNVMFSGFDMSNTTLNTSIIGITGAASASLTVTQCVFGDQGTTGIKNYINAIGSHKLTIERTTMSAINQAITSPLIYCNNGVIRLSTSLSALLTHSILNCGINSSALATSSSAGGTPAVGLDATGSQLIFANNICLTRYWVGGSSVANAVDNTGSGSTSGTTVYYSGNYVSIPNFAYGIITGGNFVKTANTLIA